MSGEASANTDPNYRLLRDSEPKQTYAVSNITLKRDAGSLLLRSGRISFVPPVLGRVTMAAFSGDGEFTLEPAIASERNYLRLITEKETVRESFKRLVLCFTDDTYEEIKRAGQSVDEAPERDALKDFRGRVRRRTETPRSMMEYLLSFESMDNVEADILADLYRARGPGFFSAYIFGRKHGDLRFHVRPRGALSQILAPEEVTVLNVDPQGSEEGIWYLAHLQDEYKQGRASSKEDKRSIHVEHYRIDTTVSRSEKLDATADITFTPQLEGERVLKFGLLPNLRVSKVTLADHEIGYIQEKRKEDSSFYVVMPEPVASGQKYKLTIEYEGNKVIRDEGGGNFAVGARTSWYPSVNAFGDRSTFDLTFRVPNKYTLVGVGKLVKEWRDQDYSASQWTSEIPLAVAGFNYGRFKKKQITDPETKYQIEGYATSELPDYLRNMEQTSGVTPSRLTEKAMAEAQGAIRIFAAYFGAAPYGRIAITQQPEFNFGQSWPTLVYLPVTSFFDATQRWMLMGGNAFRFAEFIQEVTAHEVSHQWWGHLVGFASLHDQWLSEGFAEFSAGLFLQLTQPRSDQYAKYWERARKAILDKNEYGLRPNDAGPLWTGLRLDTRKTEGAYNRLVYPKGGYILHMLRSMMYDVQSKDRRFMAMMQDFVKTYYNQNASTEDFKRIAEKYMSPHMNLDQNGKMDWFFDEWVYGTDVPRYRLDYTISEESGGKVLLKGSVTQSEVSENFKMLVPLFVDMDGQVSLLGRLGIKGNSTSPEFKVPLPKRPKRVLIDYEHPVLAAEAVSRGK